jgi:hypothetical protein
MATANQVEGLREVMINLNAEIAKIKGANIRGLMNAVAYIRNETETHAPLTPVDYGNLQSSWFAVTYHGKMANDKWNKGFRDNPDAKVQASKLAAAHNDAMAEAKAEAVAKHAMGRDTIIFGYSANYAVYVHEMMGANFNPDRKKGKKKGFRSRRPGAGAKWLQDAIYRNRDTILKIIAETSQIKK